MRAILAKIEKGIISVRGDLRAQLRLKNKDVFYVISPAIPRLLKSIIYDNFY